MNKKEFLDILRQSLVSEVDSNIVDQNLKYYNDYINENTSSNGEDIIEQLGDPRLIAKTIIETDRIAKEKEGYQQSSYTYNEENESYEDYEDHKKTKDQKSGIFISGLKWYHKTIMVGFIVLFLLLLVLIGRLFVVFLSAFAVPICLIILMLIIFRRR